MVKKTYLFLIATFTVLALFVRNSSYFGFDLVITHWIQSIQIPGFDLVMLFISKLGDPFWGSILVLFFVSVAAAANKWQTALMIAATASSMVFLNQILKLLINRPRPDPALVHVVGIIKKSDSFPSGHVMFYVGLYGFLFFIVYTQFRKNRWLRAALISLLAALIGLIGVSRIYLGVHWFSDVLGAYILGLSWLIVMIWVYAKISSRALK